MTSIPTPVRVLAAAVRANIPVMLWGEPGTSKSAIVESMLPSWGYDVEAVIASHRDPSDFNGLPMVVDGQVVFAPPRWASRVNAAEKAVVFLDEFSQATPSVQGSVLRVLNERWVGETRLAESVCFILSANPPECSAGGFELTAPASNRMVHIDWTGPSADDWALGLTNGWDSITPDFSDASLVEVDDARQAARRALVSAYIMRNPGALHNLPEDPAAAGRAWASRRSWTMLADLMAYIADDDNDALLLAATGCVGEGAGTEFVVWLQNADLPNPREVLDNPKSYDWSDARLDRTFVLLTSVVALAASDAEKETWDKAWACLAAAADAGRADLGVGAAIRLMKSAKSGWMPPKSVQAFLPALKESGLISEAKPTSKKAA